MLAVGTKRLNAILGARTGVTLVRLENPARLRLRFRDRRIALDLDGDAELVSAARAHEGYVTGETLATSVTYSERRLANTSSVTINGHRIEIAFERALKAS